MWYARVTDVTRRKQDEMGADRIQAGPLSSAGTNPYDVQAIVQDSQNNTLQVSGAGRTLALLRSNTLTLTAQTALTAITTAQTLLSKIFPLGALNVQNRRIHVEGNVVYNTTIANVATLAFALTLGGVTLCTITTAATNTAASTNLPVHFEFDFTVVSLGASATIEAHGKVEANIGTAAAGATTQYLATNAAVSSAVNLLANATLAVTIAASAAVPSMTLRDAVIEYVA